METAHLLISGDKGTVTPYGVVYDNGMVLEQSYNGHQYNECGYVACHGAMTLEELKRGDPAEQHQREQELQMGGM